MTEETWLKGNDRWKAEVTFTLTADERALVESDLEELITEETPEGVSVKVREQELPDGGISYLLTLSGDGLSSLNANCFDGDATMRKNDKGQVYIAWSPGTDYYMLRDFTVCIHGREIISGNANTMEEGSATWHTPSQIEVQVKPSGFPFAQVLGIGIAVVFLLGLLVFGGLGIFLVVHKQRSQKETA